MFTIEMVSIKKHILLKWVICHELFNVNWHSNKYTFCFTVMPLYARHFNQQIYLLDEEELVVRAQGNYQKYVNPFSLEHFEFHLQLVAVSFYTYSVILAQYVNASLKHVSIKLFRCVVFFI